MGNRSRTGCRRREAEERQRQEAAAAAERARLAEEQHERQMALSWWDELSPTQVQQLQAAVAEAPWTQAGSRVEFAQGGPTADNAYGIAAYLRQRLYGILRPSPASLHRLPAGGLVYVRNTREAQRLTDTGKIEPARIEHFDFPDHEQMSLI